MIEILPESETDWVGAWTLLSNRGSQAGTST